MKYVLSDNLVKQSVVKNRPILVLISIYFAITIALIFNWAYLTNVSLIIELFVSFYLIFITFEEDLFYYGYLIDITVAYIYKLFIYNKHFFLFYLFSNLCFLFIYFVNFSLSF